MSLIINSYDKNLKNNKIDSNTDNIHDNFYKKLLIKPNIKNEKEPEIYKYKMDRIIYSKPNYDKYDININLYSKFKNENIKLFENDNVKESKKYDNVDESLVENKLPSAYYQYKLKNVNSSKMLLNNLQTSVDIPNELNLLRLNEKTGYTISELKRDNIDRQNALDSIISNYLNKKNDYTSKTTDETKEKDKKNKDKKISRINSIPYYTQPSSLNKKIIINPAIIPTASANAEVEKKIINNIERNKQKNTTKKIIPIVKPIVNTVVTQYISEPSIESDIIYKSNEIEEIKKTNNPMKKTKQSHTESRQQKKDESDTNFEKRIKQLDKAKAKRENFAMMSAELSKKMEEDYIKRLAALNKKSATQKVITQPNTPMKTPN